jgi:hypothetical protein
VLRSYATDVRRNEKINNVREWIGFIPFRVIEIFSFKKAPQLIVGQCFRNSPFSWLFVTFFA